jgi:hypothetical protein
MKKYRVLVVLWCFALGVALSYRLRESAPPVSPVSTQAPPRCVIRPAGDVEDLPDGGKRVINSWLECEGEKPRVGVSTVYSKEELKSLGQSAKAGGAQTKTER